MSVARELFVFTADLCNFRCSHCIANADPKAKSYRISKSEIASIAREIDSDCSVSQVHFIGGEPSLQLPMIEELQRNVGREVRYAMTTNGWFANNPDSVLGRINLHEIRVSYDKFHQPFITEDRISALLNYCVERGFKTALKVTVEGISDLLPISKLLRPGVELIVNKLVSAGKAKQLPIYRNSTAAENFWNSHCPSLRDSSSGLEATVYFPSRGYTACCSSLVFNGETDVNFVFSENFTAFKSSNKLRSKINQSFEQIARNLLLDTSEVEVTSACHACELIFKKVEASGLPSLSSIIESIADDQPYFSKITEPLSHEHLQLLSKNYRVFYQCVGTTKSQEPRPAFVDSALEVVSHQTEDIELLLALEGQIMQSSAQKLTVAEATHTTRVLRDYYLPGCTHRYVVYSEGKAVGGLFVWDDFFHPALNRNVTHIGFSEFILRLKIDQCEKESRISCKDLYKISPELRR